MNKMQGQVATFMREVKGLELPPGPTFPRTEVVKLCVSLIEEEGSELFSHLLYKPSSLVDIADDLADLLYVVMYTANACGIDIEPIFDEVQRSNMTKKGGEKRADGKQLKPDTYEPPVLLPLIQEQVARAMKGG